MAVKTACLSVVLFTRVTCFLLVLWVYKYGLSYVLVHNGGKMEEKVVGHWAFLKLSEQYLGRLPVKL